MKTINGIQVYVTVQKVFLPRNDNPLEYEESDFFVASFRLEQEPNGIILGEFLREGIGLREFPDRESAEEAAFDIAMTRISNS